MKNHKGVGAPTRTTRASIGDTYTDLKTKQKYVCVSAYRSSTGYSDYGWHLAEIESKDIKNDEIVSDHNAHAAEAKVVENADSVVHADKPEDEAVEETVSQPKNNKQRYNYNKQYNKH